MNRVCIDPSVLVLAAISMLLLPLKWVFATFLAAFFHECCHWTAVCLLGGTVRQIRIGPSGVLLHLLPMTNGKELICAAAGPAGSFFLLIFCRWYPELALCGLIQGAFNLLPIYPLDGGRVLRCIFSVFFPDRAEALSFRVGILICLFLEIGFLIWRFWLAFILFAALIKICIRKIPCKEGKLAVQ